MKKTYLTKQGLLGVQTELNYLIKTRRPEISKSLKDFRASKAPSEIIEYAYVKEEQTLTEKKIHELEALIKEATIIKDIVNPDRVSIGTKIQLKFLKNNEIKTYSIVGTHEANPFDNKISNESPIVQAILGKKVNDKITVTLRSTKYQIQILSIST